MDKHVFRQDPAYLNNALQPLQGALQDFDIHIFQWEIVK
jgi:hypothetical protein